MAKAVVFKPTSDFKNINFKEKTTEFFYLLDGAERIVRNGFANAMGNTTLYTVPVGKMLFIFNISLTADNDLGATSDAINIKIANEIFFEEYVNRVGTQINSIALNLPIKVRAGENISIHAGATAKAIGSFVGYLINIEQAPNARF